MRKFLWVVVTRGAPRESTVVFTAERDSDKSACGSFFFSLTYDMESRSF